MEQRHHASPLFYLNYVKLNRNFGSVKGALPSLALPQHFRAFLVKLSLVEAQLSDLPEDGASSSRRPRLLVLIL